MANFRISDFPNTSTLTDLDIFEVSTFAGGEYTSQNINMADLATQVGQRIGESTTGGLFTPTSYGLDVWSFVSDPNNQALTFPESGSTARYQDITLDLTEFGTVPVSATHVLLQTSMEIKSSVGLPAGSSVVGEVYGLGSGVTAASLITDIDNEVNAVSVSAKRTLRAKNLGREIVANITGTNSGLITIDTWATVNVSAHPTHAVNIVGSNNIASVVRDDKGLYTISFSTPQPNLRYVISAIAGGETPTAERNVTVQPGSKTVNGFQIAINGIGDGGRNDPSLIDIQIAGEQVIGTDETGLNNGTLYVEINRSGPSPTAKIVPIVYQDASGSRTPTIANLNDFVLKASVNGFIN